MNVGIALGNLGFAMAEPMAPEDHAELCCRLAEEAERLVDLEHAELDSSVVRGWKTLPASIG